MQAVNLLPSDLRVRRGVAVSRAKALGLAAILVVGVAGYYTWSVRGDASSLNSQASQLEAQRSAIQSQIAAAQAAAQSSAQLQSYQGLVSGVASARTDWDRVIRDVTLVMPSQSWLTVMQAQTPGADSLQAPTAAPAAATGPAGAQQATVGTTVPTPVGLHLEGYTYTQGQVALVLARLSTVRGLGQPRLTSSDAANMGGRQLVKFVIDLPVDQLAQDRTQLNVGSAAGQAPAGG